MDNNSNEHKNEEAVNYEEVVELALRLSPFDRVRLIERLAWVLKNEVPKENVRPAPRPSLYGVLAHLGKAPSAEEIDDARKEAWANFPHEDI